MLMSYFSPYIWEIFGDWEGQYGSRLLIDWNRTICKFAEILFKIRHGHAASPQDSTKVLVQGGKLLFCLVCEIYGSSGSFLELTDAISSTTAIR